MNASRKAGSIADNPSILGTVGANCGYPNDWSYGRMYVDCIMAARSFAPVGSGGNFITDTTVAVKANGWPSGSFTILWASDRHYFTDDDGVYEGSFTGSASPITTSDCTVSGQTYDAPTNTTRFQVTLAAGQANPMLNFTGISSDFANLRLIRPGYAWNTTQKYSDEWMALMRQFSVIRFMDMARISTPINSYSPGTQTSWSTRLDPTTRGAGAIIRRSSWPEIIDIANTLNRHAWICVPHAVDDDYITQLAQLIKSTLRPGLQCYIEYSNEVWNTAAAYTAQNSYAQAQAKAELNWYGGSTLAADIASATNSGTNLCTIAFVRAHGRTTGDQVLALLGSSGAVLPRGAYTVTVVDSLTLTVSAAGLTNGAVTLNSSSYVIMNASSDLAYDFSVQNFNQFEAGYRWYWRRLSQIKDLFVAVFGSQALNTRLKFVAGYHIVQTSLFRLLINYLDANHGPISSWLYGVHGAPYVGTSGADANAAFAAMSVNQNTNLDYMTFWTGYAKAFGVNLLVYEYGSDLTGVSASIALAMRTDDRMAAQMLTMMQNAASVGCTLANFFDVGAEHTSGTGFFIMQSIVDGEAEKKYAGVRAGLRQPPPSISTRFQGTVPNNVAAGSTDWNKSPVAICDTDSNWTTNATNQTFAISGPKSVDIRYVFYVPTDGTYTLTLRAGANNAGITLSLSVDGVVIASNVTLSNAVNVFTVVAPQMAGVSVALAKGFHVLRAFNPACPTTTVGFNQLSIS